MTECLDQVLIDLSVLIMQEEHEKSLEIEFLVRCPNWAYSSVHVTKNIHLFSSYFLSAHDPNDAMLMIPILIKILILFQTSAWLSWLPPEDAGGRNDVTYSVQCDRCSKDVQFRPASKGLQATKLTLLELKHSTTYRIVVIAENGVSGER